MEHCRIKTRYGTYNGFVTSTGVNTWLGIPYAKPPIGPRRWHAPEPLDSCDKEIGAIEFGPSQMQHYDPYELASVRPCSEDCLTLNVWTRNIGLKGKPVMVYIHGGGYYSGGSADPLYNGEMIATRNDVVVVTINYRINFYGFMNFAEVDPEFADSGYLGIKDQVAALTWVHENIEAFGGDPGNVTLFGESAGSGSSSLLMVTPAAKGLFHKVIAESGPIQLYESYDHSKQFAPEFMELCGCKTMQEMMTKPAAEMVEPYHQFCERHYYDVELLFAPTCDGKFIPEKPLQALKDGAAKDIKLMTGTTVNEYNYWGLYYEDLEHEMPGFHDLMMPIMFDENYAGRDALYQRWQQGHRELEPGARYLEFMTQMDFRVGQELMAEYQSRFNDVYMYLFSYESTIPGLGSCHAIEVPFVFHHLDTESGMNFTGPDAPNHLADEVQAAWVNFAASGNPNSPLAPAWKPYSAEDREIMEINADEWVCHKDLNIENLKMLRHVYEDSILDRR